MADPFASSSVDSPATLLNVEQVASLLRCSRRSVSRMSESGAMPAPRRLGSLVRWSQSEIEAWVKAGCPQCRSNPKATSVAG